jgi:serine protease Do
MDIKTFIIPSLSLVLWQAVASAQDDLPLLRPEERQTVDAQTKEFYESLQPVLTRAAKSTVRIWADKQRLAYGTVIGDGHRILTKWSEVAPGSANLRVETAGGVALAAKVAGVYEDEDLVVLATDGESLIPVQWSLENPKLGAFLAASQPDGRAAAFGVVSVLERNLRDTDQAYLGVIGVMDFAGPGVKIREVASASAAAAAGLQPGNIILQVGERPISGLLELKNALVGVNPGSKVSLLVQTNNGEKKFTVVLGNRPQLPVFPGDRLRQMERMGGPISRVRDSFTRVIQTDMRPQPDQIGGPVVDLSGRVVGITVARADRTRSFVMPAAAVASLLKKEPQDPAVAQVRSRDELPALPVRERAAQGRRQFQEQERLRRHVSEMRRLLDYMRGEMRGLEP